MRNTQPTITAEVVVSSSNPEIVKLINDSQDDHLTLGIHQHDYVLQQMIGHLMLPEINEKGVPDFSSCSCVSAGYGSVVTRANLEPCEDAALFHQILIRLHLVANGETVLLCEMEIPMGMVYLPKTYPSEPVNSDMMATISFMLATIIRGRKHDLNLHRVQFIAVENLRRSAYATQTVYHHTTEQQPTNQ